MELSWLMIALVAIILVMMGLFFRKRFFMEPSDLGEGGAGAAGTPPDFYDKRESSETRESEKPE
ncbi:MAG: hypothetical protein ACLFVJ_10405 [Persicimonas sp.]